MLRFAKGARPEPGINKAIAEWPTGVDETGKQGFADYVLFVGLKPIAVVEAKRKNIDVPGKLNEAYRYSKYFDNAFCAIRFWSNLPRRYTRNPTGLRNQLARYQRHTAF